MVIVAINTNKEDNIMAYGVTGVCNFGTRPFAVAGGRMDIRGYDPRCPSWTRLAGVVENGLAFPVPAEYARAPEPYSPDCPAVAVDQDFEGHVDDRAAPSDPLHHDAWDGHA